MDLSQSALPSFAPNLFGNIRRCFGIIGIACLGALHGTGITQNQMVCQVEAIKLDAKQPVVERQSLRSRSLKMLCLLALLVKATAQGPDCEHINGTRDVITLSNLPHAYDAAAISAPNDPERLGLAELVIMGLLCGCVLGVPGSGSVLQLVI